MSVGYRTSFVDLGHARVAHALNYHIIYVYLHGLPDEGSKELIHQPLVGGPSILQPRGQLQMQFFLGPRGTRVFDGTPKTHP